MKLLDLCTLGSHWDPVDHPNIGLHIGCSGGHGHNESGSRTAHWMRTSFAQAWPTRTKRCDRTRHNRRQCRRCAMLVHQVVQCLLGCDLPDGVFPKQKLPSCGLHRRFERVIIYECGLPRLRPDSDVIFDEFHAKSCNSRRRACGDIALLGSRCFTPSILGHCSLQSQDRGLWMKIRPRQLVDVACWNRRSQQSIGTPWDLETFQLFTLGVEQSQLLLAVVLSPG